MILLILIILTRWYDWIRVESLKRSWGLIYSKKSWKSRLSRLFINLLVFKSNFGSYWRRILSKLVIQPASNLEFDSFHISHSQRSHPSSAPSCSSSISYYLSLIIVKSFNFLQIFWSLIFIKSTRLAKHNPLTPDFINFFEFSK